jgi:hypothetical protein
MLCAVAAFGGLTRGPSVPVEYYSAHVADVNGDGLTDFVHDRFMMVNQGGGNFARIHLGLPGWDSVVRIWDVNGDGRSDFFVSDHPTAPPGSEAGPRTYSLYIMGEQLTLGPRIALGKGIAPYIADMNGDGKDDLVLITGVRERGVVVAARVTVHISRGDGTFAARQPFVMPIPAMWDGARLLTGDLNHDGIHDLVMRSSDGLVTMLGTGNGDFAAPVVRYLPGRHFNGSTGDMLLADIDGDSHLDIVIAGPRLVRVFMGDGAGRFPRLASAPIALLRNPPVPIGRDSLMLEGATPRLAVGQFVRSGRNELLAGIREGDLVVFAYESNRLREVARIETEFLSPQVFVGAYRAPGRTDVYVTGAMWNNGWPTPALLYVDETLPAAARAIAGGRSRAVRGFASGPATKFDVQLRGDSCVTTSFDSWSVTREGIWGSHRTADKAVDIVHEGDIMSVRFTAPWATAPVEAYLERKGNSYVGKTHAATACVTSRVEVTVTPR